MYFTSEIVEGDDINGGSVQCATGVCFLAPRKTVQMEISVLSEDGVAG